MPALPALLLRSAPRRDAGAAGTAWLAPCRALTRQIGQGWRGLAAPLPRAVSWLAPPQFWRERAIERAMDAMAARVAQAELALLREQRQSRQQAQRAEQAEAALVRLQDMLDQLRREQRERNPA